MTFLIILIAAILILCIVADKISYKFGMPGLLLFIGIGMVFGSDGIFKIPFDNYEITENICTIALGFIMFYGGFNTKWKIARPVAVKAVLLSTMGVLITAFLTMAFCYWVLRFPFAESFLVGAVISSTDAASVFAILRREKLNLKDGLASLLEIESGSNDPVSYTLTIIGIFLVKNEPLAVIPYAVFAQVVYGVLMGIALAVVGNWVLTKTQLVGEGLDMVMILALVLLGIGLSDVVGGNGFLCIYLLGILLGNGNIKNKKNIVPFFDGITGMSQMLIFFLLGLLAFPHKLPAILPTAIVIALFLAVVARPVAVFALLKPFKCPTKQCILVSFAGLRGASSIVFSIMVIAGCNGISKDLFHIVFMVSLLSVAIQGTLLPQISRKLQLIDAGADVRKTFNDYQEEEALTLMQLFVPKGHNWENRMISQVSMPTGALALMIKRGKETVITRGNTTILAGDTVILSVPAYREKETSNLEEIEIDKNHKWCNKRIDNLSLSNNMLIVMVKKGEECVIPKGSTLLECGDRVVLYHGK